MQTEEHEGEGGAAAPKFRAKLDADGIYWGAEQVAAIAEGDVEVPEDCDLKPGAYRWNPVPVDGDGTRHPARFEPLPRKQRREVPGAPTSERALYELLVLMKLRGEELPQPCTDWAVQYEQSIDAKGMQRKFSEGGK